MILITGASGHLGKATVNALLKKGVKPASLSVLVRDETKVSEIKQQGVTVKIGDYNNYESLVEAFKGIDKLFFVSGSDVFNRVKQHENVVKAAKEAGVPYIVYTSFASNDETATSAIAMVAISHLKTEELIKESGISYTILKNAIYMDMLPMFMGEQVLQTGVIAQPAGNGKSAYASRNDIAEVAANILTSDEHEGEIYTLAGERSYSYGDIAGILTEITGKEIKYISPTAEEFGKMLKEAQVPDEYIGLFTAFSVAKGNNEFNTPGTTLEKLLGRKPTTMEVFLKSVYSKQPSNHLETVN